MRYKVVGDDVQYVVVELSEGEKIYGEAGAMNHMTPNIKMEAKLKGGIFGALKRAFTGESLFLTEFTCESGTGVVAFSPAVPGHIIPIELKEGEEIIAQGGAYLASTENIEINPEFKLKFSLFGGESLILQKITGEGTVFLSAYGSIIEYDLNEGEEILISSGLFVASRGCKVDVTTVKGLKSIFFSGEGLFLTRVIGPGKVWIQSMSIDGLASMIARFITVR
jgi:uncharacterized protein (TIGR00266 family)